MDLPDDDEETIALFTAWTYIGHLEVVLPLYSHDKIDYRHHLKLLRLVQFSDKIGCPELQRDAVDQLCLALYLEYSPEQQGTLHPEVTTYAWSELPEHSIIKRMLVNYFVHSKANADTITWDQHAPGFLAAVAKEYKDSRSQKELFDIKDVPITNIYQQHLRSLLGVGPASCPRCHKRRTEDHDRRLLDTKTCIPCCDRDCGSAAHLDSEVTTALDACLMSGM